MATRILVIDDEEDYRLIVSDVLKGAGYEVKGAEDGVAGLEALRSFPADAVLVDWMMPRLDGEGFCREMRRDPRFSSLPVVMLTVKQTADEELEALHFGVDDFLVKPFKPSELLARVKAVLRRSKPAGPAGA